MISEAHPSHRSSEQPPKAMPDVKSSPDLGMLKSACKERDENWGVDSSPTSFSNHFRSFEFCEDPAFWNEHNVQIQEETKKGIHVEGIHGLSTPLADGKKIYDYEVALVAALRRQKAEDIAMQALTAEIQAAKQLAKQREDEIHRLKRRVRFWDSAFKRMESLVPEPHLLREEVQPLRELEELMNQVERNEEVTIIAIENLRLNEKIRRLKSFYEEGGRERMNEQIMILQKLLQEVLERKLMHDLNPQKPVPLHILHSMSKAEMDALQRKLDEENESLERQKSDLIKQLQSLKSSSSSPDPPPLANNFQSQVLGFLPQWLRLTLLHLEPFCKKIRRFF